MRESPANWLRFCSQQQWIFHSITAFLGSQKISCEIKSTYILSRFTLPKVADVFIPMLQWEESKCVCTRILDNLAMSMGVSVLICVSLVAPGSWGRAQIDNLISLLRSTLTLRVKSRGTSQAPHSTLLSISWSPKCPRSIFIRESAIIKHAQIDCALHS